MHWSFDGWQTSCTTATPQESGWNLQYLDLPAETLASGRQIVFTFYWKKDARWEGREFEVTVE